MHVNWRKEAFVLIVMVSMLVYLPLWLGDIGTSSTAISWFIVGWLGVRASALLVQGRRRGHAKPHS